MQSATIPRDQSLITARGGYKMEGGGGGGGASEVLPLQSGRGFGVDKVWGSITRELDILAKRVYVRIYPL